MKVTDLTYAELDDLFQRTDELRQSPPPNSLAGRVVGLLFFEDSTRTRLGFHAATHRLGGSVIEMTRTKTSPNMASPESLRDTLNSIASYFDCLVIRHSVEAEFQAAVLASPVPVISGGQGRSAHPTQALIDAYVIRNAFDSIKGLRIGILGLISSSRTARSLLQILTLYPPSLLRIMTPEPKPANDLAADFPASKIEWLPRPDFKNLDVLYCSGLPITNDPPLLGGAREPFLLSRENIELLPPEAIVLCPLPRIDEIDPAVDSSSRAMYFEQSQIGLFVRMSVLEFILNVGRRRH